ncbi:septum site-determining protein MinD [Methanofollis formosanus]|uniref:Septum site-determining protein MinD n=1 Tax=Methanofollis formosanus TaxID=299308 RepID=A0A8G1A188_9EURY|nr:cell division ATPase MinD [Methanofollis formosanus]QYZ78818.1 septum site-determining protein MinD [Methanofollis formosanus]
MIKAYTIASGKGGTGKTTMTVNLGTALAQLGKETYILDADVGMANIGILLGLENVPVTLHEVLAGKATVEEAAYEGPAGLKVVPCGISLQGFQDANPDRLREVMHDLVNRCDYLLIDAPAGISRDGVVPLAIADEVILVVNPELSSIVDGLKTKILTELVGGNVRYAIINRAGRDNVDFVERKIEKSLGVQSLGAVPEDTFVRESAAYKTPIVIKHPTSPASRAIKRIAAEIAGCEYHDDGAVEREGFIERLARTLFRGKN